MVEASERRMWFAEGRIGVATTPLKAVSTWRDGGGFSAVRSA
jgi:hypothetical protein